MFNYKFLSYNSKKKSLETIYLFGPKIGNTFGKTFFSSILVMCFFYVTPIFINFVDREIFVEEFENKSREIMVYKLSGQGSDKSNDKEISQNILDEKDLLSDIIILNNTENDTVRLNTSTISKLFEDTNYKLNDVRKNKLVKPVALTWLPYEIKQIQSTNERKELFIQIILPLILEENNNIKLDRIKLFSIINKSNNTKLEKRWLNKK